MREAFRLNLSSSACWRIARANTRSLIYILVFLALIVVEISKGNNWQQVGMLAGVIAVILILSWLRIERSILKNAKTLSTSCNSLTIDTQGLAAKMANGTRTSIPWSAITRWREGNLVFTIGDAKTFRTVPKGPLGESQSGQLRSLLLTQIRSGDHAIR
jgi:hypothetical protein